MSFLDFFQNKPNEQTYFPPSFFYFYFPSDKKADANELGKKMRSSGYDVKIHQLEAGVNPSEEWSVVASKAILPKELQNLDKIDSEMDALAEEYGGDYDGREVPMG